MNELILIRGVSGSGKTTLAKTMARGLGTNAVFAADDWFYDPDGNYNFDPTQLGQAHRDCQENVQHVMLARSPTKYIVVHNTFTTEKEMQPYLQRAESYNYKVTVIVAENRHGHESVHNVPDEVLDRQRMRLKGSIKL